jgi:hypothetical protein
MKGHIHIVCFDVPYPVSHGGFFDLYYKLKALHAIGVKIHLHCFEYGRGEAKELENYCVSCTYYQRKKWTGISFKLPFIVSSRANRQLEENLSKDDHPILLEGIHTSHILHKQLFANRTILLRMHNIEQTYYLQLFENESNWLKRFYFKREAQLLKKYESSVLEKAIKVFAVSEKDAQDLQLMAPTASIEYLPLFLPYTEVTSIAGKGDFILYHGNLSVAENENAVIHIVQSLAGKNYPLIVAGRKPSSKLKAYLAAFTQVTLREDPTDVELEELITAAHINIVHSLNATGIKIKLLHALFKGRHCTANDAAVPGAAFRPLVHIANNASELRERVDALMETAFTENDIEARRSFLPAHFNNSQNAGKINAFLQ